MIIDNIILEQKRFNLKSPYRLSFVTLNYFDSFQVTIVLKNGKKSTGEVVPLPGYTPESPDSILFYLKTMQNTLINLPLMEARNIVAGDIKNKPFHTTALLTAMDLFTYQFNSQLATSNIDFVFPVSTKKSAEFHHGIQHALTMGKTIKIKLSGDPNQDILCLEYLLSLGISPKEKIRLDANQKYSLEDARILCSYLLQKGFENHIAYLEQALDATKWEEHSQLQCEYPNIAIMLDESIVTASDVVKAHDYKMTFIKLKLFKQGGIVELLKLANLAHQLNIKVVLGNGVATGLSNNIEIDLHLKFPSLFYGASEANGFMKIMNESRDCYA